MFGESNFKSQYSFKKYFNAKLKTKIVKKDDFPHFLISHKNDDGEWVTLEKKYKTVKGVPYSLKIVKENINGQDTDIVKFGLVDIEKGVLATINSSLSYTCKTILNCFFRLAEEGLQNEVITINFAHAKNKDNGEYLYSKKDGKPIYNTWVNGTQTGNVKPLIGFKWENGETVGDGTPLSDEFYQRLKEAGKYGNEAKRNASNTFYLEKFEELGIEEKFKTFRQEVLTPILSQRFPAEETEQNQETVEVTSEKENEVSQESQTETKVDETPEMEPQTTETQVVEEEDDLPF